MHTYRKKPVKVTAVQFTQESANMLLGWIADEQATATGHVNAEGQWDAIKVWTLEGELIAQPGDWIIRGVAGEFYPCKPDIFEATYTSVREAEPSDIIELDITNSTDALAVEIRDARLKAHRKHGANSIEAISATDPRWLSILAEEVGEAAEPILAAGLLAMLGRIGHELTYDATGSLRAELVDMVTVGTAWIASLDASAARA